MPIKDKEKHRQYCKEYYHRRINENPNFHKEYYQTYKEKIQAKSRRNHLKRTYDLSLEDYDQLLIDQNNVCAICKQPEYRVMKTGLVKPLSIDHCHTSGKIRALLCNDCNACLGFAKESPEVLRAMALYLEEHHE